MSEFSNAMQQRMNELTRIETNLRNNILQNKDTVKRLWGTAFDHTNENRDHDKRELDRWQEVVRNQESELSKVQSEIISLTSQIQNHELALVPQPVVHHDNSLEVAQIQAEEAQAKRDHEAAEAQKQRDHELQMAIIQRDTALAQAEQAKLAAEANAKAQEQASSSLDALISGVTGNGAAKDGQ